MYKKSIKAVSLSLILIISLFNIISCTENDTTTKSYDYKLMSLGYYFESLDDAINYFEEQYTNTNKERDLIDLCRCLNQSNAYMDKKMRYYPDLFILAESYNGNINGLSPSKLIEIYSDYAYQAYKENKDNGKNILLSKSVLVTDKLEYYNTFFRILDNWETDDFSLAYQIYEEIYDEFKQYPESRRQIGLVLRLYEYSKQLGFQYEAESYYNEFEIMMESINNMPDLYNETSNLIDNYGYHFDDDRAFEAVIFFEQEYLETKDERALADLCTCISMMYEQEYDCYRIKYYRELFNNIDQNGYNMGLSIDTLDKIYYDWIRLSLVSDDMDFVDTLSKYAKKSKNYSRIVTWVIDLVILHGGHDDYLVLIYNDGITYLEKIDMDQISNTEIIDLMDLCYGLEIITNILGDKVDSQRLSVSCEKVRLLFENAFISY